MCEKDLLLEKEQFYIDTLKPEYNCCKVAGRTTGLISPRRKAVLQYNLDGDLIKVFDCLQDIMTFFNLSNSSKITKVCRLERRKAYGYVWRYFGEEFIPFSYKKRKGVPVAEVNENGEILRQWNTIKECAEELSTSSAVLCNILSPKTRAKTLKGRIFKYL